MTSIENISLNRRSFIKQTLAGSAALSFASVPSFSLAENQMPFSQLGKTGLQLSRVGVGGWQIGTADIQQDKVNEIVATALDHGINFFDTAPNYGKSEERLGIAIDGKRKDLVIATKTEEQTYDGTWQLLEQSLKRLGTDYIDIIYLHSLGNQKRFTDIPLLLSDNGGLKALVEAKEQKILKTVGVSGHSFPTLFHQVLDTGHIDVLMNAVNFVSQHIYNFEDKIWARAHQDGLGLVAMKVLGGANDQGIRIPKEHYRAAIQYALFGTPAQTAVVGMESAEQVVELVNTVRAIHEMTEEEQYKYYKIGLSLSEEPRWKTPYGGPIT